MAIETVVARPLTPAIGAEIEGIDLRRPITPDVFEAVRDALLAHGVIFFRDQDIPVDYRIEATDRLVGPPVKGGSVVTFQAQRVQAVGGALVVEIDGRAVTPAYGQLTVTADGKTYESPIGRDGEFYLENLPRGRHPAVIDHKDASCRFTLETPAPTASMVDVGTVRCIAR